MYKVLVADDEMVECLALERMLRELSLPLQILPSARNGEELLHCVEKEKPDVAIVDINMPGINGLEALDIIRFRSQKMEMIIHSAYFEYDYMQKAMQLGAIDYILKPASKRNVEKAVKKAMKKLDGELETRDLQKEKDHLIEQMLKIVKKELAMSVLMGKTDESSFRIYQKQSCQRGESGVMLACQISPAGISAEAVYAWLDQSLERFCSHFGMAYQGKLYLWLCIDAEEQKEQYDRWLREILRVLQQEVWQRFQAEITIGVSRPKTQFEQIGSALREARIALQMNGREPHGQVFFGIKMHEPGKNPFQSLLGEKPELQIQGVKNKFLEEDISTAPLSALKLWAIDFLCQSTEASDIFGELPFDSIEKWNEIWKQERWEDVRNWLLSMLEKREDTGKSRAVTLYTEKGLKFMEEHYSQDISLDNAAEYAGVSSFYLSRLFRQELGRSFVEVLTGLRLTRALSLIREGELSTREISTAVGYGNPVYFGRVLKKHTGMTARQIREFWMQNTQEDEE